MCHLLITCWYQTTVHFFDEFLNGTKLYLKVINTHSSSFATTVKRLTFALFFHSSKWMLVLFFYLFQSIRMDRHKSILTQMVSLMKLCPGEIMIINKAVSFVINPHYSAGKEYFFRLGKNVVCICCYVNNLLVKYVRKVDPMRLLCNVFKLVLVIFTHIQSSGNGQLSNNVRIRKGRTTVSFPRSGALIGQLPWGGFEFDRNSIGIAIFCHFLSDCRPRWTQQ